VVGLKCWSVISYSGLPCNHVQLNGSFQWSLDYFSFLINTISDVDVMIILKKIQEVKKIYIRLNSISMRSCGGL
jgi:hypothetical protein